MAPKVVPFRKGFAQSPAQLKRADAYKQINMLLRRASVYDALLGGQAGDGGSAKEGTARGGGGTRGGPPTFPGFASKVNIYFQTEAEAVEFQRLVHSIRRH